MDYLIELDFAGPGFVPVPNHVADDARLSDGAVAVLVFLARQAAQRRGVLRVSVVRERFGYGKDKWQRIARELRAVGALGDVYGRTGDGRSIVRAVAVRWPAPAAKRPARAAKPARTCEPGNPAHRVPVPAETCEPGNPADRAENPAQVGRETRLPSRDTEGARREAVQRRSGAARAAGSVERSAEGGRQPVRSASSRGETARTGERPAEAQPEAAASFRGERRGEALAGGSAEAPQGAENGHGPAASAELTRPASAPGGAEWTRLGVWSAQALTARRAGQPYRGPDGNWCPPDRRQREPEGVS